jgi:hypothetical protein
MDDNELGHPGAFLILHFSQLHDDSPRAAMLCRIAHNRPKLQLALWNPVHPFWTPQRQVNGQVNNEVSNSDQLSFSASAMMSSETSTSSHSFQVS